MMLGGLLALAPMSGCKLDDPVIPTEELYLRNFIKQYGLIDPTQDFSSAEQSSITLRVASRADVVNVYAQVGEDYYRVGCFANIEDMAELTVDIPKETRLVKVDADGIISYTVPKGTALIKAMTTEKNATESAFYNDLWIDPSGWSNLANGETGNSYSPRRENVVIGENGKMSAGIYTEDGESYIDVTKTAHIAAKLNGTKNDRFVRLGEHSHNGEIGNTGKDTNVRFHIVNNDDVLSSYKLTFRTASRNDAELRVVIIGKTSDGDDLNLFLDSKNLQVENNLTGDGSTGTFDTGREGYYTEWELRTELMPKGDYELIIMGVEATPLYGNDYCGNWGFLRIERLKKVSDMRWILACEDLGTTDDFDFNDVVFSIEAISTNTAALKLGVIDWQVVDNKNENGTVLLPVSRAASRADDLSEADSKTYQTRVKVTALAAGGTLPIWLHFREESDKVDNIVCLDDGLKPATDADAQSEKNEWHRWFDINSSKMMLNTGVESHRPGKTVTFTTQKPFSLENFCYLKFDTGGDSPYGEAWDDSGLDEWGRKILQWKWQKEHSQEVTYGFFLTVYEPLVNGSQSHILSKSLSGLPPQMFLIPDCVPSWNSGYVDEKYGWKWPCERVDITTVYPNFQTWVQDKFSGSHWFLFPKAGIVTSDGLLYPRDPDEYDKVVLKDQYDDDTSSK